MDRFYITSSIFVMFFVFQCLYVVTPIIKAKRSKITHFLFLQKPISILVPAYNEQDVIINCIDSLVNLNYREYEILIINDGSTDDTLNKLKKELDLYFVRRAGRDQLSYGAVEGVYQSSSYTNIFVIDKANGGKADALNTGIDYAEHDIVVTIDADCIIEKNALNHINLNFSDKNVLGAGGTVQVAQSFGEYIENSKLSFKGNGLVKHQLIDYLNAFHIRRLTQQYHQSLSIIAGAFGVFRRPVLLAIGGYRNTIGEDMDITLKIQRYIRTKMKSGKLICIPEAIAFTEAPEDLKNLLKQRVRWQKAFIDCIMLYKKPFLSGQFSWRLILFVLGEALVFGIINSVSVLLLPLYFLYGSDFQIVFYFFLLSYYTLLSQNLISLWVSHLYGLVFNKKDYLKMILFIPIEIVTYRLMTVFIFVYGTMMYFINKNSWNKVKRMGSLSNYPVHQTLKIQKGSVRYHDTIENHFYYRLFLADRNSDSPTYSSHLS